MLPLAELAPSLVSPLYSNVTFLGKSPLATYFKIARAHTHHTVQTLFYFHFFHNTYHRLTYILFCCLILNKK